MFRKVTIVGVGLMGGSIGLAIKKYGLAKEVVGLSHRQSSLMQAIKMKAIDSGLVDVPKAIRNADFVILAAPVESIIQLFATINPYLKRGCIVTDVGSSKGEIVDAAEKILTVPNFFVGSHPLIGSEKKGVNHSNAELFEKSQCLMTPTDKTNTVAKEKVKQFWTKIGAQVGFIPAEEHDQILASVSHLPHLIAYGLIETIPQEYLKYAPQSLIETTRIASSSPQLWNDICLSNSKNVVKSLDDLVKGLAQLRKAIVSQDQKKLMEYFSSAKGKRDSLSS